MEAIITGEYRLHIAYTRTSTNDTMEICINNGDTARRCVLVYLQVLTQRVIYVGQNSVGRLYSGMPHSRGLVFHSINNNLAAYGTIKRTTEAETDNFYSSTISIMFIGLESCKVSFLVLDTRVRRNGNIYLIFIYD